MLNCVEHKMHFDSYCFEFYEQLNLHAKLSRV